MPFWKTKKGPKSPKSRATTRCKRLWGKIVRLIYPACQRCGKPSTAGHHVITRQTAVKTWWFDVKFGVGVCTACHGLAHSTDVDEQIMFRSWAIKWLDENGKDYEKLKIIARARGSSLREPDLLILEIDLKRQLKELSNATPAPSGN